MTPKCKILSKHILHHHSDQDLQVLTNFSEINQFTFLTPDMNRYPCLQLAIDLVKEEGNSIPIMSIANDHVVELFLNNKISFLDIPKTIEKTVKKFQSKEEPSTKDLIQLNQEIKVYLDSNYHDL